MSRKRLQHGDQNGPPTVRTVAALAGVSIASASRVLNGLGASAETERKVREAAASVGYVPNAVARSLQARRTDMLALAVEDIGNPVYVAMMRAIEEVAARAGYRLQVHATGADPAGEVELIDGLARRYVDGLVISPIRVTAAHLTALARVPTPVVVVGSLPDDAPTGARPVDNVRADSHTGVALAVAHLVAGGRRRIAFVNGPLDTVPGAARHAGYLAALAANGLIADPALIETGDFHHAAGREATRRLLDRERPDAILCANDLIAVGALHALLAAGKRVPEDVALVGMDDTDLAEMSFPQLSSVSLGSAERGRIAAELLLRRLAEPTRPAQRVTVAPELKIRASSAHAIAAVPAPRIGETP
ncbi:ribose operon repressor RbsR [Actinorhabdospora filicis]|uniref:Ribose operon repressor RbsR n=1 Tax=Actinorhabdospora filicis TaxID=1785913 RepID=A0A9W6SQL6_9ACTN|nr:LacI family DNA-binding transcriptional regulator [Actinorhabdospora filicis]GLZ80199.1 ribose operon repressor RbsR [Actinorhabdospora filicis]